MIVIIDLHCDASMPAGAYDFGGGSKYSRNLISLLLSENIPFLYFTCKKFDVLEENIQLTPNACFYRIPFDGITDKELLLKHRQHILDYISNILERYNHLELVFHSIYWSSGEIAFHFAEKYNTFFIHTVLSNGKSKRALGATEDVDDIRCHTEEFIFNKAKYIICSSVSEADDLYKYYNISRTKLIVTGRLIENPFLYPYYDFNGNPHTYSFSPNMPLHYLTPKSDENPENLNSIWWTAKAFIFVGRVHKNKGIDYIITAWLKLYQRYQQAMPPLWIIGGVPDDIEDFRKSFEQKLLYTAEKQYKIVWWGTLSPEGISTLMLKGLAFIFHSKYEAGGNVILEAMSHSMPVIATPYGYARDFVKNNKNGYLVSYGDITLLSYYMEYFIKQPYLSNYMGRMSKEMLKNEISDWNFKQAHLCLYEGKIAAQSKKETIQNIPLDSVDIYPHELAIPSNMAIRQILITFTSLIPNLIKSKGNIQTYFLWEVYTLSGRYYFYYFYPLLNWDCIFKDQINYIYTKYERVQKAKDLCFQQDIEILYVDESSGYILLNQVLNYD